MNKRESIWIHPIWALGTQIVLLWSYTPKGKRLTLSRYELTSKRLPAGFDGLSIVQLSDLHGRIFKPNSDELVEKVAMLTPDLIVLTGDMFDKTHTRKQRQAILDLMERLCERSVVYAILGNHETRSPKRSRIISEMRETGVRLLGNQGAILERGGDRIGIAGVETDPMKELYDIEDNQHVQGKLEKAMARYEKDPVPFRILLAHKPELLGQYAEAGADLVFSGHAHGGLMEIPFSGGKRLLAPGQGLFPHYAQGLYRKENAMLVLSSGLGGPRVGLQPEIVHVTLRSGQIGREFEG